jgi:type IV pilus assembly protein PilY1
MYESRIHPAGAAVATALLVLAAGSPARAVPISEVPLFVTTSVTPNVMLLVDDSGSMDNIIWHDDFDPTVTYTDWSPSSNGNKFWTSADGNIYRSDLVSSTWRGSCSSGWTRGRNSSGTTKCLRLPDPAGDNNTRFTGNYLNWLFSTYANNTDLRGGQIPNQTRMQVARNVATNLVTSFSSMRLGLASLNPPTNSNPGPGGKIEAACGSSTSTLTTAIAGLAATTNTPLAEAYYEITRYFRGMSPYYNSSPSKYTSPIQYRCQKNYVVVLTDGYPTRDGSFPDNDPQDVAIKGKSLPNWDGKAPATTASQYPNFPQFSDGFAPSGSDADEGYRLYLDDLALFGYEIDLRTAEDGKDETGVSWDHPTFQKQNLITYTVGFAVDNQMLEDAAFYGNGKYYTAKNEAQLTAALSGAFEDIVEREGSASSVATNSTRLDTDTRVYQALFSTADWGGQLLAIGIESDGSVGDVEWNAKDQLPAAASRNIYTWVPGAGGREFAWENLAAAQQTWLNTSVTGSADGLGQSRLAYLRGDQSVEVAQGGSLRNRSSRLGDIIGSDPLYVAKQNYGFDVLPGAEGSSYRSFRSSESYKSRNNMVYVAANDGILHGFDADTGTEVLAFLPNSVFPRLRYYTHQSFNTNHKLLHDGGPRAQDAYIDGAWRTILLGSLGGGGRAVYALDVTDPEDFDGSNVLWEFSSSEDSDLGYTIAQPTIARMNNGKWAAIVPNGYNSTGGRAVLFILDLETGAVIREIDTGVGDDNGLSSPTPVDVDGDRITDFIYAGDLKGNLWKFDVTSNSASNWKIAFGTEASPQPLYTACKSDPCTTNNRQPITARPEVGVNPPEGYYVYFGTGRYFATGDSGVGTGANTFYAIRDKNEKGDTTPTLPTAGRSNLVEQEILSAQTINYDGHIEGVRTSTNNGITNDKDGWYMDLPETGERQISTPILRGGRIIFTTVTPSGDACSAGGSSWLMELDAVSGSRLDVSPFDLNRDGLFNHLDFAPLTPESDNDVPVSGRQSREGIIKTPGVITGPDGRVEYKYASGSTGGIDTTVESASEQRGRQSWREIR